MVTVTGAGRCTFRVYLPNAGSVDLLGSFSNWDPNDPGTMPMLREGEGWWSTTRPMSCGEHEFCYLVDGQLWMPDYAAGGIRRNEAGKWISLLSVVEETARTAKEREEAPPGFTAEYKGTAREARTSAQPEYVMPGR